MVADRGQPAAHPDAGRAGRLAGHGPRATTGATPCSARWSACSAARSRWCCSCGWPRSAPDRTARHDGSVTVLLGFTQAIALTMSVAFLVYVYVIIVPYLRHKPARAGRSGRVRLALPGAVPGRGVRRRRDRALPAHDVPAGARLGDRRRLGRPHRPRRRRACGSGHGDTRARTSTWSAACRPEARTGKGDALNAAYRALKDWIGRHSDTGTADPRGGGRRRPARRPNCLDICAARQPVRRREGSARCRSTSG